MNANDSHYTGVRKQLARYWGIYGGARALRGSPYLHIAIGLTVLCAGYWSSKDWTTQALSVLPNLLGFTLGGFAVFLGFGDDKFRALIAGNDDEDGGGNGSSPYLNMSATFLHFVLVQAIALLWAIVGGAMHNVQHGRSGTFRLILDALAFVGDGLGYLLFLYAILAGVAAALAVFRAARWYDHFATNERQRAPKE